MVCDLHVHSKASDGSDAPSEILRIAEKHGISAVALCDHNTVDGLPEFLKAAENSDVIAVSGCEFSSDYNGDELHILGLFIPEEKFGEISEKMHSVHERKEISSRNLCAALQKEGYDIDYDEIVKKRGTNNINRSPIADELIAKGCPMTKNELFDTLLSDGENGLYRPPERLGAVEIIEYINSIGAVSVWAHPLYKREAKVVDEILPLLKAHGLVGMETVYSEYSEEQHKAAVAIAEKYGLKQSGGSDYHGRGKEHISMGSGMGNLVIPFEFYENLKK